MLQPSIWLATGMSCCHRNFFSLSGSSERDSCSHSLSSSSFGGQSLKFLSMSLLLGIYSRIKDSMHEFKMYFLRHLWYLPLSVFQRVLLASSVPQPACGREWDGSSGNVRRWKCFLQFAVQNWFERVGRGRRRMCRSCSERWMAKVLGSCLFFRESSCNKLSSLLQLNKTTVKNCFLFGVKCNILSYWSWLVNCDFFKRSNTGSF